MILFSIKSAAFRIAGGSISKHRWEVCSMKSPWVFQVVSDFRLALVSLLFGLAVVYMFRFLTLTVFQLDIGLLRLPLRPQ